MAAIVASTWRAFTGASASLRATSAYSRGGGGLPFLGVSKLRSGDNLVLCLFFKATPPVEVRATLLVRDEREPLRSQVISLPLWAALYPIASLQPTHL